MKSPFPGMDPYLEKHWGDVHARLIVYMCDQINEQLPSGLQARVEESLMVDADDYSRRVYPDVKVAERSDQDHVPRPTSSTVAVAEPYVILLQDEPRIQRHVEIIDRNSGNRVVTAIELLSPANKRTLEGRRSYQGKQRDYLEAGINLVEIDLVREGEFVLAVPPSLLPLHCQTPYLVCIRRALQPKQAFIIPIPLQLPLPAIPIPLREQDPDISIELQPLLDACYRRGRYDSLDYDQPCPVRFSEADRRWMERQLKSLRNDDTPRNENVHGSEPE